MGSGTIEFWDLQPETMSEKRWDSSILYMMPHTEGVIFVRIWHLSLEMPLLGFDEMKVLRKKPYHVLHFLRVNSEHAHCYQAPTCVFPIAGFLSAWSLQY